MNINGIFIGMTSISGGGWGHVYSGPVKAGDKITYNGGGNGSIDQYHVKFIPSIK